MVESYGMIFTQKNFEELQSLEKEFKLIPRMHIYMVIKSKKYNFGKDIEIYKNKIHLQIFQENKTAIGVCELDFSEDIGDVKLSHNCDEIEIRGLNKNIILNANVINIVLGLGIKNDFEVVYIGQSFGTNGSRNVYDRLKSHSTLQKIYFEKEDNRSIYLTAWNFDRNTMTLVQPNEKYAAYKEKLMFQLELQRNPYKLLSKEQEISITEAALIRYFQPKYNTEYKSTFPSVKHSDYNEFFKIGLDYIAVEMDTSRLNFNLCSQTIKAKHSHDMFFDLKGKRSMYDFFGVS